MGEEQSDRNVLVGHPERERAIAILNDAFSGGYLEVTEFEERSAQVYAARTRGDLRAAVEKLPTAAQLFGDSAHSANIPVPTAATTSSVVEFDADWTTVRRKGGWKVEQRMLFTGSMGTVDLDFTNAVLPGPIVYVELQVSTSSVKIRLGPDQDVRLDDLSSSGWSSVKNRAGPPHRPGGAVIVVRGSISGWSSIVVKRS